MVSPDSPDTAITNLMSHMFDFTLNHFYCPQKARNAKPVREVEELVLVALHHHDRPDHKVNQLQDHPKWLHQYLALV